MLTTARSARAVVLFAPLLFACLPECNPESDCDPEESHCEGQVAVVCRAEGEPGDPTHAAFHIARTPCSAPYRCVETTRDAVCALAPEPCDPATFEQRCVDGRPVVCQGTANHEAVTYVQQLGPACADGNTCVAGGCGLPSDTPCDPSTYSPTCVDGKPVTCEHMGEPASRRFRLSHPEPDCADGNRCIVHDGHAGCGRSETVCDPNTARDRCEDGSVVRCRVAYGRAGASRIGLEYVVPCPRGCATSDGDARCVD